MKTFEQTVEYLLRPHITMYLETGIKQVGYGSLLDMLAEPLIFIDSRLVLDDLVEFAQYELFTERAVRHIKHLIGVLTVAIAKEKNDGEQTKTSSGHLHIE